ncbi:hypothetical protein BJY00DRAFT_276213 [Aspergillus carlsbadensis]|nr:hypothetical protein BJY00DRAFT_276213 [Aspergillus carlsbadensis]
MPTFSTRKIHQLTNAERPPLRNLKSKPQHSAHPPREQMQRARQGPARPTRSAPRRGHRIDTHHPAPAQGGAESCECDGRRWADGAAPCRFGGAWGCGGCAAQGGG